MTAQVRPPVSGGGSGAVSSVNARTGAVTGLAEASALTTEATTRGTNDATLAAAVVAEAATARAAEAKINGVSVTGTPTAGQVPTATSGSAASWQTPSGGGGVGVGDYASLKGAAPFSITSDFPNHTWAQSASEVEGSTFVFSDLAPETLVVTRSCLVAVSTYLALGGPVTCGQVYAALTGNAEDLDYHGTDIQYGNSPYIVNPPISSFPMPLPTVVFRMDAGNIIFLNVGVDGPSAVASGAGASYVYAVALT